MNHANFIKSCLVNRGDKTAYAKKIGISLSFLKQIETRMAKTPRSKFIKVIECTHGKVTLQDLISEVKQEKRANNQKTASTVKTKGADQ